ncbi:hypothetical protein GCM10011402_34960 [Paracoccus acridae]|uniref:Carboxymuconolactone decarboxylase-like domain-containing protein n=1 Tax=Paracoccus acridae TaxID=1795310 RepID=A0ABQ1VM36_9RHOB|nr:carboxymuconolactone decarboxylase family protein [Paracoccus acridae]GGF79317.1 hypothetical protein GCM10011402_34960 [Paracoccus acridae]
MTPREQQIRDHFIARRGYWRPWVEALLKTRPDFVQAYADYAGEAVAQGPLTPRMVELIYVALDASATHLYANGLRTHMDLALKAGATEADLMDVFALLSAQGLECVRAGADILAEELGVATSGDGLAALSPAYARTLRDFEQALERPGGLKPVERAIIRTALFACFTGFQEGGLRRAIRQALDLGAAQGELLQAIQLGAHLSVHGTAMGAQLFTSATPET